MDFIASKYPFNLSYTAYSTYCKSPLEFYYRYIIKAEEDTETPRVYGVAGGLVHECVEEYIKNPNFPYKLYFDLEWEFLDVASMKGLYNSRVKYEVYYDALDYFIKVVKDSRPDVFNNTPEYKFEFMWSDILVKGYIDWLFETKNNVYIIDWKTDSTGDYEKHKKQRLFYTWALFQSDVCKNMSCEWVYGRLKKSEEDSFKFRDLQDFEEELKQFLDNITAWGDDITKYEVGDYKHPFNAHYKKCEEMEKLREGGNKMAEIKLIPPKSDEQKTLEKLREDKYSKGAMIGAYMNHWVTSHKDELPSFEEFVKKNVELRIELENMEYGDKN